VIADILRSSGIDCRVLASVEEVVEDLAAPRRRLIAAEEAFVTGSLTGLEAWLAAQPPWSDLPVILLTLRREMAAQQSDSRRGWAMSPSSSAPSRHPGVLGPRGAPRPRPPARGGAPRGPARRGAGGAAPERGALPDALRVGGRGLLHHRDDRGREGRPSTIASSRRTPPSSANPACPGRRPAHARARARPRAALVRDLRTCRRDREAVRFEEGSAALERWWDVHAFRVGEPGQRRVAVLFNDITARAGRNSPFRRSTPR
jgi:hypothetical protein